MFARLRCFLRGFHNTGTRLPVGGYRCMDCRTAVDSFGTVSVSAVASIRRSS